MRKLPGRIIIRGLRCQGRQGPTPGDRESPHEYLVDIGVSADVADAAARDELAAAIDIAALASGIREEVARRPRVLLERLAADVAASVLERFGSISEVSVKVEKPEPEGLGAAAEAVELTMARTARARGR